MTDDPVAPRRLHPITLLQRFLVSLPGFAVLLLATYRSPDSSNWAGLVITILYAIVALPFIYLRYERFRYWITSEELVIKSGVITRQHRNIPLEKIQNVEIVQRLLPRMTGTARVEVVTAGSASAEGVLEFVSLDEAHRIRRIVREFHVRPTTDTTPAEAAPVAALPEEPRQWLYNMSLERVLLSGVFRFSLLYIAIGFSAIQLFQPDPERLAEWFLQDRLEPFKDAIQRSPYFAAVSAVIVASLLSWISGILVNLNKYYRFHLWIDGKKVAKRSGLLTLSEGSIPIRKVQALIFKSNPVMRLFDWWSLQLQTMGLDVREAGHRMAVPFARWHEIMEILPAIVGYGPASSFTPVSPKRVGRLFVRYTAALMALVAVLRIWWSGSWLLLLALPMFLLLAWGQWRNHGYSMQPDSVVVRRGILNHRIWVLPSKKMQVFYTTQSLFQRRRNLKSVYIDSAGASPMALPTIIDVEAEIADALVHDAYESFRLASVQPVSSSPSLRTTQSPR